MRGFNPQVILKTFTRLCGKDKGRGEVKGHAWWGWKAVGLATAWDLLSAGFLGDLINGYSS